MSNRIKLTDLSSMKTAEIAGLPVDQLAALLDDVNEMKEQEKRLRALLTNALAARYQETAARLRREARKDAGIVRFQDGEFEVVADLPKKVDWCQEKLAAVERTIREAWKADPAEYMKLERKVSETAFNAWPAELRRVFEPARTLRVGKPVFELVRKEAA